MRLFFLKSIVWNEHTYLNKKPITTYIIKAFNKSHGSYINAQNSRGGDVEARGNMSQKFVLQKHNSTANWPSNICHVKLRLVMWKQ